MTAPLPEAPRIPAELQVLEDALLTDDAAWVDADLRGELLGEDGGVGDVVDVEITGSRLIGCRLAGATIERLRLTDVVLDGCDLSGAVLDGADLTRVAFEGCRMSGTVLARARMRDVRFDRCKADGMNLRMMKGTRVTFDDTVLRGAELLSATIEYGNLLACDLTEADVTKASLQGAHLHRSVLDGLRGASHLRGVVIDSTQLVPLALRLFAAARIVIDDEQGDEDG